MAKSDLLHPGALMSSAKGMYKVKFKSFVPLLLAIIMQFPILSSRDGTSAKPPSSQFNADTDYRRALLFEGDKKWHSAIPLLEKCIKASPCMEKAWLELGRCYLEVRDYMKAEKALVAAQSKFSADSTQKQLLKSLMRCYGMSGQLEALEEVRKQYVSKYPREADSAEVREQIGYYDKDFARTRKLESRQANYLKEGYLPWLKFSLLPIMPIKVCIEPGKDIENGNAPFAKRVSKRYAELAKMAFEAWKIASGETLTFEYVEKNADAQLLCSWTTDLKYRNNCWADGEANYVQNSSQGPVSTKALVFLNAKAPMDDYRFYFVVLHEIGHALGLHHSSRPEDVMYGAMKEHAKKLDRLTANDVYRIRRLYADPFLGKDAAERFAQAAFIDRDYETAYSLLTSDERNRISQEEFENKLKKQEPDTLPDSLKVVHFDRGPNDRFNYSLEGVNAEKKFFYHVGIERTKYETFLVTQARLAAIEKL